MAESELRFGFIKAKFSHSHSEQLRERLILANPWITAEIATIDAAATEAPITEATVMEEEAISIVITGDSRADIAEHPGSRMKLKMLRKEAATDVNAQKS